MFLCNLILYKNHFFLIEFFVKIALIIFFCFIATLQADFADFSEYILPVDHPLHNSVTRLFSDPDILTSREDLEQAGFDLLKHNHRGLVVAKHPQLKNHLIKLFINNVSHDLQIQNYISRIRGAQALQQYIAEKCLKHIVVPKKWLVPIKQNKLGIFYVLMVEEQDILSSSECRQAYSLCSDAVLEEICLVVTKFRGLDSVTKNMPLTRDGKIAFIDTEKWKSRRTAFLSHVKPYLNDSQLKIIERYDTNSPADTLDQFILSTDHPLHQKLQALFTSRVMFDSTKRLAKRGFEINKRVHQKLAVFTHPSIPNYIFKKYLNSVDNATQMDLYVKRLQGAKVIKAVIDEHSLKNIVVPEKWLFKLPYAEDEYLVVAEYFDLCPGDDDPKQENVRRYRQIEYKTLKELCTVMKQLGGCDAWPRNQPFTTDGKIAFIDTEHVGQKEAHFHRHILPLLDSRRQEFAKQCLYGL